MDTHAPHLSSHTPATELVVDKEPEREREREREKKRRLKSADVFPPKTIYGKAKSAGQHKKYRFHLGDLLGKGAFAKCFVVREAGKDIPYAAKVMQKKNFTTTSQREKLKTEIRMHRRLRHNHLVSYHSFFEDRDYYYLILELANQKTLRSLVRRRGHITEIEARYYMMQVVDGVEYLHQNNIIHRDLKLDNLLIKDMQVKIADFGLSVQLTRPHELRSSVCGTPNYIAPEVLLKRGHSFPVDVWALGVITFVLMTGRAPFETPQKSVEQTYARIKAHKYSFDEASRSRLTSDAINVVDFLLNPDPNQRPKVNNVRNHRWFCRFSPKILSSSSLVNVPLWNAKQLAWVGRPSSSPYKHAPVRKPLTPIPAAKLALSANKRPRSQSPLELANALIQQSPYKRLKVSDVDKIAAHVDQAMQLQDKQEKVRAIPSSTGREVIVIGADDEVVIVENSTSDAPVVPRGESTISVKSLEQNFARVREPFCEHVRNQSNPAPIRNSHAAPSMSGLVPGPSRWIVKWLDYSRRFGLGYALCNGCIGVVFTDGSNIISNPVSGEIMLVYPPLNGHHRVITTLGVTESLDEITNHFLKKRITLLRHFEECLRSCHPSRGLEDEKPFTDTAEDRMVYVTKYERHATAIVFYYSDGSVQYNSYNHHKIVISPLPHSPAVPVPEAALACKTVNVDGEPSHHNLLPCGSAVTLDEPNALTGQEVIFYSEVHNSLPQFEELFLALDPNHEPPVLNTTERRRQFWDLKAPLKA
eukprot:TRINITY_DN1282_c0_g1_i1.p1 TRINITY_DN1282_c0_g1~~TRINITY_DN1282_c0_g1_i1.p1  ORF type:complete len:757 (-),score=147.87 TRINITY_DN1282_c0_g1_i1:137-2407(-)